MKGKNLQRIYTNQQEHYSDLTEKSKLYIQVRVKRIQDYQTSFTTNTKGNSLGGIPKGKKKPTNQIPNNLKMW